MHGKAPGRDGSHTGTQQVLMSARWGHLPDQIPGPQFLCVCPLSCWPGASHPEALGGRPCMGGWDIWTWLFEHYSEPVVWVLIWVSGAYTQLQQLPIAHPTPFGEQQRALERTRVWDVCVCSRGQA